MNPEIIFPNLEHANKCANAIKIRKQNESNKKQRKKEVETKLMIENL